MTFERQGSGRGELWRPVLRSYPSLIAATCVLVAALGPESRDDTLITLMAPDDLKAIVAGPMLSLVMGCGIEAHGVFSRADLDGSVLSTRSARLVAPGWMEGALRRHVPSCPRLILAHDAPVRLPGAEPGLDAVDFVALGESAVLAAPRREGLAVTLESAMGCASTGLGVRIDPQDGRIHIGGPAAEVTRMSRSEDGAGLPVGSTSKHDAPTSFGVERFADRVIGILSLA